MKFVIKETISSKTNISNIRGFYIVTENQKKMLFIIEVFRNRDKDFIAENPGSIPFAENLLEYFFIEIGDPDGLYETLKDRTGVTCTTALAQG